MFGGVYWRRLSPITSPQTKPEELHRSVLLSIAASRSHRVSAVSQFSLAACSCFFVPCFFVCRDGRTFRGTGRLEDVEDFEEGLYTKSTPRGDNVDDSAV